MESNRAQLMTFICNHASRFLIAEFALSANLLSEEDAGRVLVELKKLEASWALNGKKNG